MPIKKPYNDLKLPDYAQIKIFGDKTRTIVYIPDFLNYVKDNIYDEDEIKALIINEISNHFTEGNITVDLDPDKQKLTTLLTSDATIETVGGALVYLDEDVALVKQFVLDQIEITNIKISSLETSIINNITDISQLKTQMNAVNQIIENESYNNMVAHQNFEDMLSQMNGKVDTATTLAKKASQDVESLNYALDSVKDDFNVLRSTVEANEKRTDTLETNYDALSYDLSQFLIVVNQKFEEQQKALEMETEERCQDTLRLQVEIDELKKTVSPMSLVASVSESFSTPVNVGSFETKVITIADESIKQGDLAMVSCEAGYTENGNLQYSASVLKDGEVNVYILNQSNVSLTVDKDINVKVVRFVA